MSRLLGTNREFTLLWFGVAISTLGGTSCTVAVPLLVLSISHSPSQLGFVTAIGMIAALAMHMPAGAIVDRFDKRNVMLGCEICSTAIQGLLAAAIITHEITVSRLIALTIIGAPFGAIFGAAHDPAVRHLVSAEQLPLAFARNEARSYAATLLGPPLGGALFAVDAPLPFILNAATTPVSALCIALIRTRLPSTMDHQRAGVSHGLRWILSQPFIRTTLFLIAGLNLVSNALFVAAIVISRHNGDPAAATGALLTIGSIGGLLGAFAAPRLLKRLSVRTILIGNRCIWALLIVPFAVVHNAYAMGALFAGMFFIGPTGGTAAVTAQMGRTPEDMQGRVAAARTFCTGLAAPIGTALIGVSLGTFGDTASILVLAGFMGLLALIATHALPKTG
jgi:MFS family permease